MTHTPEPWPELSENGPMLWYCFDDGTERVAMLRETDYARARVCVNACAGMTDPAAELASLRAEVERLRKENQTLSDMSQGKDDAIAELRHDLETLRADLDSQTFREELDTPKEPPDAQVRPR